MKEKADQKTVDFLCFSLRIQAVSFLQVPLKRIYIITKIIGAGQGIFTFRLGMGRDIVYPIPIG